MNVSCKACKRPMSLVYEVLERETVFVLWECACGHKELERRPGAPGARPAALVGAGVAALAGAASIGDDSE